MNNTCNIIVGVVLIIFVIVGFFAFFKINIHNKNILELSKRVSVLESPQGHQGAPQPLVQQLIGKSNVTISITKKVNPAVSESESAFSNVLAIVSSEYPSAESQLKDLRKRWKTDQKESWNTNSLVEIESISENGEPIFTDGKSLKQEALHAELQALEAYDTGVRQLLRGEAPKTYQAIKKRIDDHKKYLEAELKRLET